VNFPTYSTLPRLQAADMVFGTASTASPEATGDGHVKNEHIAQLYGEQP
jgi:hypothetical protein